MLSVNQWKITKETVKQSVLLKAVIITIIEAGQGGDFLEWQN